jgi:hypothetical protein
LLAGALAGCEASEVEPPEADDDCEQSADALAECADASCDLEELEAMLAMCQVDDKSDGIGDTFREWMERIQAKLASKAEACYEARDAACLERVYWTLAAGAKLKGMPNAAAMMWNFLSCGDDPAGIDPDAVQADKNAKSVIAGHDTHAWEYAESLARTGTDGSHMLAIAGVATPADSADLWYAMGTFSIRAEATVRIFASAVERVDLRYTAYDRYDWHPGAQAGGEAEGVDTFADEWAQFLVDEGAACEFEMRAEWTGTLTERPEPPMFDVDDLPRNDGECCEPHGGLGCEVHECQAAVCAMDPYCCESQWEEVCVGQAAMVEACGCN